MFHQDARVNTVLASVVTGRLHVSGDMGLAVQLQSLFPISRGLILLSLVPLDFR